MDFIDYMAVWITDDEKSLQAERANEARSKFRDSLLLEGVELEEVCCDTIINYLLFRISKRPTTVEFTSSKFTFPGVLCASTLRT